MSRVKQIPEVLMTGVFVICLVMVGYSNHIHNNSMVQWSLNLAGQAFASITTLVVKGALTPPSQQETVSTTVSKI
jgi:hypothetical protein